jgi:hypothetical protein
MYTQDAAEVPVGWHDEKERIRLAKPRNNSELREKSNVNERIREGDRGKQRNLYTSWV